MNLKYLFLLTTVCNAMWLQAADGTLNTGGFNAAASQGTLGGNTAGFWYVMQAGSYTGESQGRSAVVQPTTNKIIVAGSAKGNTVGFLVRLNMNGTLDTSFGSSGVVEVVPNAGTNFVLGVTAQADGKIIVGGLMAPPGGVGVRFTIARFTAAGVLDTGVGGFNLAGSNPYGGTQPGYFMIKDGGAFTGSGFCGTVAMQPDQNIVASGFVTIGGASQFIVIRLTTTGTLDTAGFNAAGSVPGMWYKADAATTPVNVQTAYFNGATGDVYSEHAVCVQSDGKIVIATQLRSSTRLAALIRLQSNGTIDSTFNPSGSDPYGGTIPGYFVIQAGGTGLFSNGSAYSVMQDANGKLVMTGYGYSGTNTPTAADGLTVFVARVSSTGVLDTDFNPAPGSSPYGGTTPGFWMVEKSSGIFTGAITAGSTASSSVFDGSQRILVTATLVVGSLNKVVVFRLTPTGVLDTTFKVATSNPYGGAIPGIWYMTSGAGGIFSNTRNQSTNGILYIRNGQIIVSCFPDTGGPSIRFCATSLVSKDGLLQDTASPFNTSLNGLILTTTIDQAGKIVAGGYYGTNGMALRYTSTAGRDGSGATTFGVNGVRLLTSLTTTSSLNKIINAASDTYLATGQSNNVFTTLKLTSGGALDTSFNTVGYVVETAITGTNTGYDMLLNGTALAVAGVTGTTNTPSVINYNATTGARNSSIYSNGLQQFSSIGTGIMYGIQTTTGAKKYGAGQAASTAFLRSLGDTTGILQDTASPFNTGLNGLILTTTIDQAGKIVAGGYYGTNGMAVRYTTAAARDTFGTSGVLQLTSLTATSSLNKIINAASNTYLATGQSNNVFTTLKLTSGGALDTSFNTVGYVVETAITGTNTGYDMLLNGTALAVAGVTGTTNTPSVINYSATTGARTAGIGFNGLQQFSNLGTGIIYGIQTTTGSKRYGAGQGNNIAFVRSLGDTAGILQDTADPFNTGATGLLYSTTITQAGNLVVGGQYNNLWEVVSYLPTAARNTSFNTNGVAAAPSGFTGGRVRAVALDSTGRIIATGATVNGSPTEIFSTVRYNSTGTTSTTVRETTFGVGSGFGLYVNDDDTFEVVGFTTTGTSETPTIMSYDASAVNLNVDQFTTLVPGQFYAMQETGGSFFVAGSSEDTAIVYSLLDGTGLLRDTEPPFDTGYNGIMYGGIYDSNDSIVLCGTYNNIFTVVRYTSVGERDPFTVGVNGVLQEPSLNAATGYAITQDSADSYYVAAESTVDGNLVFTVVKYLYSGVLDTTFGNGGIIQETALGIGKASAIKINSDGTIFVGGQTTVNGVLLPTLIKYTSAGARFSTFGTNGVQTFSNFGTGTLNDLTIISIRTVVAAGQMGSVATLVEFGQSSDLLAQLNNGF